MIVKIFHLFIYLFRDYDTKYPIKSRNDAFKDEKDSITIFEDDHFKIYRKRNVCEEEYATSQWLKM